MSKNGSNLITNILKEAESYTSFDIIESYIEAGQDLSNLPVQPLYVAIKSLPTETVANALEKFSPKQRQVFLDLDLWRKDDIDPDSFSFWIDVYSKCTDDTIKSEFLNSAEFSLFLKGRMSMWTFDVEDPEYPDHDYYFLTEDNLLLFEFEEDYPYIPEVRQFIADLYTEHGVEGAYQFLFKVIAEGFLSMQEEEYRFKKHRLNDLGFVDYYDALELCNPFPSLSHINLFLNKKESTTPELDLESRNQCLDKNALIAFKDQVDDLSEEIAKIDSKERLSYLQFNFTRLINSSLTIEDALKDGALAMTRIGKKTLNNLQLGFSYLREFTKTEGIEKFNEQGLFNSFDFVEVFNIGHSLILFEQKRVKKALASTDFNSENETFLGEVLGNILDEIFSEPPMFISNKVDNKKVNVNSFENLLSVQGDISLMVGLLPFAKGFFTTFKELENSGKIMDDYYLNFGVSDIDFEALLLSTFINFANGVVLDGESGKIGLSVTELKNFSKNVMASPLELTTKIDEFTSSFGLNQVHQINEYFKALITYHLSGYDINNLSDEEFRHVGGPLLLNNRDN
ncbi:DUF6178 family protein [Halobacteriovorax sp. JY17]|uniref:DUF6178 family protein n=1 Tax=Halobacteriovorax sp. JY17 TaxID=2014617 RepID=UPI000C4979C5|nr:DUF6178 family protein [Halobacteriovorax sp. JY17]PIK15426.1 MAG: hypothetical protein CES88_01535 [Halobacteriovorax sp. JY17]